MGVREGNRELKVQLEEVLSRRQTEIRKILEDYGMPLLSLYRGDPSKVVW